MKNSFPAPTSSQILKSSLALGAAAIASPQADAQIVVSNFGNTLTNGGDNKFTFNTGTGVVSVAGSISGSVGYFNARTDAPGKGAARFGTYNQTWFQPTSSFLSAGALVNGASTFTTQKLFGSSYGGAPSITNGYIGLRFDQTGGDASDAYFGWMRFSYSDTVGLTVKEFGMQTLPNTGINTGQTSAVPEPSAVAALMGLAAGAAAVVARRRQKAA